MKTKLTIILFFSCLLNATFSESGTHLDIAIPSRMASSLFGPVKKVTQEYEYDMSGRKYKEVFVYDQAGNLQTRTKWDTRNKICYAVTNTISATGNKIAQRVEDIREKTTNDYEIVLNIPAKKMAYRCKLTGEIEVVSYNDDRYRMSATIKKKGGKTLPLSSYTRSPDNRKKTYTRYTDKGRPKYTLVYDWNDQNLISRTLATYKTEKRKDLNVYEYLNIDEHGNWTQSLLQTYDMLNNKEKKFEKFSTRTIEYFENNEEESNESI